MITLYDYISQRPPIAGAMAERCELGNRRSHRLPILLFVVDSFLTFVCHARIQTRIRRLWSVAHQYGPLV